MKEAMEHNGTEYDLLLEISRRQLVHGVDRGSFPDDAKRLERYREILRGDDKRIDRESRLARKPASSAAGES